MSSEEYDAKESATRILSELNDNAKKIFLSKVRQKIHNQQRDKKSAKGATLHAFSQMHKE